VFLSFLWLAATLGCQPLIYSRREYLCDEIETFYRTTRLSDGLIGLRDAVEAALIIAEAAMHNRQSRGCHFREDSTPEEGGRLI
jgi:aspartate oxidase